MAIIEKTGVVPKIPRSKILAVGLKTGLILALVVAFYSLFPDPPNPSPGQGVTDAQIFQFLGSTRRAPAVTNKHLYPYARFGKKLFHAASPNDPEGRSCVSCHHLGESGVNQLSAPILASFHNRQWFDRIGSATTLVAKILQHWEAADGGNQTRLGLLTTVKQRHLASYQSLFGNIPKKNWPRRGKKKRPLLKIPNNLLAYALATIRGDDVLESILSEANTQHEAASKTVGKRAYDQSPINESEKNYEILHPFDQKRINTFYFNLGFAVAAYLETIQLGDSAFDRFAQQALSLRDIHPALDASFNQKSLHGLKLFIGKGQCTLCHNGPQLSNHMFYNIGLERWDQNINLGRLLGIAKAKADPYSCQHAPSKHARSSKTNNVCQP